MAQSERRVSLGELIRHAGVSPATTRQPCLSPPPQPSNISNDEDRIQAREILVRRRQKNPESKDAMLKRIFKSSKEKDKAMDTSQWEFSQDELDQALSAVIRNPDSNPGLVQALLNFGAKVNYVDTTDKKKSKNNAPSTGPRRRSTVLQQAATLRKVDSVNLLACSGADQTTLDEGLKAALTAQDQPCIEELLRHGADLNRFPNALPAAVQSNDQNLVQILLRAPKGPRVEVISSCLLPAVRQDSETLASLLLSYGADPNFDYASAINTAIGKEDWRLTLTLVSGPIPLGSQNLQRLLDTVMRLRTCEATLQFLQILLCCGLPPNSIGLPDLLICRVRKNCTPGSRMMINHGVPTTANDAECLRLAIENTNWVLVDAILETPIEPRHASAALDSLPSEMLQSDRVLIVQRLLTKGAGGRPLGRWLNIAVKEHDLPLLELLLKSGAPVDAQSIALQTAIEGGAGNLDVIQRLLAVNSSLLGPALESTIALEDPSKKKPLIDALLQLGIPQEALDQGLTAETRLATKTKDLSTTTVLMRQGASWKAPTLTI